METRVTVSSRLRQIVRWGLYAFSWCVLCIGFVALLAFGVEPKWVSGPALGFLFTLYLILEFVIPYERRWAMTWRSFLSDAAFAGANGLTIFAINAALGAFLVDLSGARHGPATQWPIAAQLLSCLLIFEAFNYALHRLMHEAPGSFGRVLWRIHAAHHLPPRLYLIMHAVFHPFNALIIQSAAIVLPAWFMGYDKSVLTMFVMINGMHGLISHFNVDVRLGWANYIFIGTETHRYHHSADPHEGKNYGAVLSIYDILFGTFVYRPGVAPERLGVNDDLGLPAYSQFFRVLALPFLSSGKIVPHVEL